MKWQRFEAFCQQGVRFDRACCVARAPLFDGDELYDLQDDPYDMHNLIDDPGHAAVREDLRQRLAAHIEASLSAKDGSMQRLLLALRHGYR